MRKVNTGPEKDVDMQVVLGTLLRVGVITSMAIILIGGAIYLLHNHTHAVDYRKFNPHDAHYAAVADIFSGLIQGEGAGIIQFGILLLIFTPVLRIVFSVFGFLIEGDYRYVCIGLFVFAVIMFSLSNSLTG